MTSQSVMAESSAVSHINIKPEHVTCEICLKCFDDNEKLPRTLPCHHSFCTECLISVWDRAPDGVTCPKCHNLCPVEGSIESSIAVSGMLKGMTEYMLLKNKPEQIRCHECPDNQNAAVRCVNCREFMCSSCAKYHKKFAGTKQHKTVSLSELVEMPAEEFFHEKESCEMHPYMMNDLFCETCTTAVCSSCTLIHHKDHNIDDLNSVYIKKTNLILDALRSLQKSTKQNEEYRAALKSDNSKLGEIEVSVEKCVTQIKNVSEEQKEKVRSNVARQKTVRDEKLMTIGQLESGRADHVTLCQQAMQFARQTELINMSEDLESKTKSLLENTHIVDIPLEEIPRNNIFLLLEKLFAERPKGKLFIVEESVSDGTKTRSILIKTEQGRFSKVLLPTLTADKSSCFNSIIFKSPVWHSTISLNTVTPTYYETECLITERQTGYKMTQQQRRERCKVADLGLWPKYHSDDARHISECELATYVEVFLNTDNSFYLSIYSPTKTVFRSPMTGHTHNSVITLTLGLFLNTTYNSLHIIDVKQKKVFHSTRDLDLSKPMLPVYEVRNSDCLNIDVKMIPGDNISLNTDILTLMSNFLTGKHRKKKNK